MNRPALSLLPLLLCAVVSASNEDERAGERLPREAVQGARIETMETVLERAAQEPPTTEVHPMKQRAGAQGSWVVPSRRFTRTPHSGAHYATNKWGDALMGIDFGRTVELTGVWVLGHAEDGARTNGLRAIGYRAGREVARTEWFERIDDEPRWFEIGLAAIDRVEFEARAVLNGAGFFGIDDLTYRAGDANVVVDFDDLGWRAKLTGSGYAGLTWETGRGAFDEVPTVVPPPQVPPGHVEDDASSGTTEGWSGGGGTLPNLVTTIGGPRLGDPGAGWLPPDTCGAAGIDHFVAVVNQHLSVYDKVTGDRLVSTSMQSFFGAGGSVGDPRVAFDEHDQRWVVIATDFAEGAYFAYSLTADPTGAWFKSFIDMAQGSDAGKWPDYPTLGVDARGIYMGAYMVGGSNRMTLFAIDKAPLLSGTPSLGAITAWRELLWEGALQPCVTHGDPGREYVVSRVNGSNMRLRSVNPPLDNPTLSELGFVSVPSHGSPPSAPALGSQVNLDTLGTRLMNAVYRNGSVWTAHTVAFGGRAAARWYELSTAPVGLAQVGTVSDPELYYFIPSISVNSMNAAVVAFTGSNANQYAGCYYTGRQASDPSGETAPPFQYKPGEAPYNQAQSGTNRWGDYSLTSVDPVDDATIWTIQEYAATSNRWGTFIAELETCAPPVTYCTAKAGLVCGTPAIQSIGKPSAGASNGFFVFALPARSQRQGVLLYSDAGRAALPFQGGLLCINPPLRRAPPTSSGGSTGCDGEFLLDVNAFASGNAGGNPAGFLTTLGTIVNVQWWGRDSAQTGSFLSNGLEYTVCP